MEGYDILMLVVLIGAAVFGAVKGFAWQLASIGSIVVSYMVAYNFREPVSQSIRADPPWNRFLAMLILFIGTSLVIWVAFRMISRTIDRLKLREFDRQVGALFGLAKGALYCTLITMFAVTLLGDNTREKIVSSTSGRYISQLLDRSEAVIPEEIHDVVQPYLDRFEKRFHGEEVEGGGLLPDWRPDSELADSLPQAIWDKASRAIDGAATSADQPAWPPADYSAPQPRYPPSAAGAQPAPSNFQPDFQQAQQPGGQAIPPWRQYQRKPATNW